MIKTDVNFTNFPLDHIECRLDLYNMSNQIIIMSNLFVFQ